MDLNRRLGLPTKLGSVLKENIDLKKLAELAYNDVCHLCNPRSVSKQDFYNLYESAL